MNNLIAITSMTDIMDNMTLGGVLTAIFLFSFFVIISVFLAVLIGGMCSVFFDTTLPKWWAAIRNFFKEFFSLDIVFGNEYDYPRKKYNDFRRAEPCKAPCATHELTKSKSEKYKWQMFSGIPSGDSDLIDTVIERCKSSPFHNETPLQVIESWKAKGAVRIFTSLNHYRCKKCWATEVHEYYTMPIKIDGRPLVEVGMNDTYASKFKQTTRISTVTPVATTTTTNTRREIPVEALPYHFS